MKATLTVNGNSIDIELNAEQYEKLFPEEKKKTGYEKVEEDEQYWYVDSAVNVSPDSVGWNLNWENSRYKNANYFSNEEVANNMARAQKLWNQIHRRAVELCEPVAWQPGDDGWEYKYGIMWSLTDISGERRIRPAIQDSTRQFGNVYFDSLEHAEQCIEEFKDELTWYFTKFKDRADM